MKSTTQKKFACDPATLDEGNVRLGDFSPYFAPADRPLKTPPAEIADDGEVRLGDSGVYF